MIFAVVYTLAAIFALLFGAVEGTSAALPAYHAWQHGKCLARTAVLERELGIDVTNPELLPRPDTSPEAAAQRWADAASSASDNYRDAVIRFATSSRPLRSMAVTRQTKAQRESDDYRPSWRRY